MNSAHLIHKRFAFIADCVAEIRKLGRVDLLASDKVQERFHPAADRRTRSRGSPRVRPQHSRSRRGLRPKAADRLRWCGPAHLGLHGQDGRGLLRQRFVEMSNVTLRDEVRPLQILRKQRTELRGALAGFGVFVR